MMSLYHLTENTPRCTGHRQVNRIRKQAGKTKVRLTTGRTEYVRQDMYIKTESA